MDFWGTKQPRISYHVGTYLFGCNTTESDVLSIATIGSPTYLRSKSKDNFYLKLYAVSMMQPNKNPQGKPIVRDSRRICSLERPSGLQTH